MGYIRVDNKHLQDIADAIREKRGNRGETRTETVIETVTQPVTAVCKTASAIDANTADPELHYYRVVTGDIFGNYTEEEEAQLAINEDTRSVKVGRVSGAVKVQVDISYQMGGIALDDGDIIYIMPGITETFDESIGVKISKVDYDNITKATYTFTGTNAISIWMYVRQTGEGIGQPRQGLLGYYASITGYDSNDSLITEEVEIEVSKEVPNTYTPAEMAGGILKIEPASYVAYIEVTGQRYTFFSEPFTTEGIVVTAHYSDGSSAVVDNWTSSISNGTQLEDGAYQVVVTYIDDNGVAAEYKYNIKSYTLNIVTWSDGSDKDVAAMIAAADAGKINLSDYWNIGDERVITFRDDAITSEDNAILKELGFETDFIYSRTLVLARANPSEYEYVSPTEGRTFANFIVHFKECSVGEGKLDTSNLELYTSTLISTLLDKVWYENLPDCLQDSIKPVKVMCYKPPKAPYYDTRGYEIKNYRIFLPSAREVGLADADDEPQLVKWEYYILDSDNIYKYAPESTLVHPWWTRSGLMRVLNGMMTTEFYIATSDSVRLPAATKTPHLAPAFCI